MPNFDGTGPSGEGPLTGRGNGFCILKRNAEDRTNHWYGFFGERMHPVEFLQNNQTTFRKEAMKMPAGDRTGPQGMGPMTGRASGLGAGYGRPGYLNPNPGYALNDYRDAYPPAYAPGFGFVPAQYGGWGRGGGRRGGGRGRRFGW